MFATEPSSSESMTFELNTPRLDVPAMTRPILENYDMHVNNFIKFLRDRLEIHLIYEGPDNIREHILRKTVYACSVYCKPKKILKDIFPVMIGSRLDLAIRHRHIQSFEKPLDLSEKFPFQELDIGTGFFIISGFLRQLPYFYTNDPTNSHVVQRKIVRVYSYNAQDRGKELSLYVTDANKRKCGDIVIANNDGSETGNDPYFFHHCPYPVNMTAYMNQLYRDEHFDIDHLGNKMVISPGHMFTKLFIKYLYGPLKEQDWKLVKSRTALVCNSIENGYLLHVLSRKTVYFKETKSIGKMTNEPSSSHREIGANGEVFMEKNIGCYREVLSQTYPLNPYLLYVIVRQLSKKVKNSSVNSFHLSYLFFLCILGIFETKNVGRTTMMVRDTIVSTCADLDPVYNDMPNESFWNMLGLIPQKDSSYYVVVNEACIPVSKKCFDSIDLMKLKFHFQTIECYIRNRFIIIRYKAGLIMKKVPELPIWVTPYDIEYWTWRLGISFSNMTSYIVDLNRFFKHTSFPKVILAINSLKNSVLATDPKYAFYFLDTISTYVRSPTPNHKVLVEPEDDGISKHFVLMMPQPIVAYMSFEGCAQEDCIVKRKDYRSFDCFRFYTVRLRLKTHPATWVKFYPVHGDSDSDLMGTLISGEPLEIEPSLIHVRLDKINLNEYRIYFNKSPFRYVQHFIVDDNLSICVEQEHICSTGDKLCSLHGQKGVIREVEKMPLLDGKVEPDLIINPYCMFRGTPGQILEAKYLGGGKDSKFLVTPSGIVIECTVFYGRVYYHTSIYFSKEHIYAPKKNTTDKVHGQPVKGRSRQGGMKMGDMEKNAARGNGIASSLEEKCCEHSDLIVHNNIPMPKSALVIIEDLKCFKFNIQFETHPPVELDEAPTIVFPNEKAATSFKKICRHFTECDVVIHNNS